MQVGTHGTTYGGNPLATTIGMAVLDMVLAPGFLDHVKAMGLLLKQRLAELKDTHPEVIADVRGEGLMLGLGLNVPVANFVAAGRQEKILVIPASENVARLLPPLIIKEEEIAEAIRRLDATCVRLETEMGLLQKRAAL